MDYIEMLRNSGLKSTKSRSGILNILAQMDQPISAEQIFLELKKKNISANLSTVYRTLDVLADKNLATRISISGNSRNLYEFNRMNHRHYLVCLGCHKIIAINHCPLADYETKLEKETNYSITGHKLNIYGYCPDCQGKLSYKE